MGSGHGNILPEATKVASGRVSAKTGEPHGSFAGAVGSLTKFDWLTSQLGCPPDTLIRPAIEAAGNAYRSYLTNVANQISTPHGQVVVVGYPAIFEKPELWNETAKLVHLCHGVNEESVQRIRGWAGLLNAKIGEAVRAANAGHPNGVSFTFVNVQDGAGNVGPHGTNPLTNPNLFEAQGSSDRHNLCGTDSWMNGINDSPFHPNFKGHTAEASVIAPIIATLDWSQLGKSDAPVSAGGGGSGGGGSGGGGGGVIAPLQFAVTGSCDSNGGALSAQSSGFTPGGRYTITAWYPSGQQYPLASGAAGTVRSSGSVAWDWPCAGDPSGDYATELVDSSTGRSTGRVGFHIGAPPTPPPARTTYPETTGGQVHTWTNYTNAGGQEGPTIPGQTTVQIACKIQGFQVADGNTWWYRIAESPWNDQYYGSADAFYNNGQTSGSLRGTPFYDPNVPDC